MSKGYAKNVVSTIRPLNLLHIDLFSLTRAKSLTNRKYSLVIIDDFSRFTWVIFLANIFKMKKAFTSHPLELTTEVSLKIMFLKCFVFFTISLLVEHLT